MNKIILMGRLVRDPEIRYSRGEKPVAIARYSLAVDRKYKHEDGITVDFFQVVAFGYQADFAAKYLRKGMKLLISGHAQTGTYQNKDQVKMSFFEIVVEEQEFAESKNSNPSNKTTESDKANVPFTDSNGFMQIPDDMEELPFH